MEGESKIRFRRAQPDAACRVASCPAMTSEQQRELYAGLPSSIFPFRSVIIVDNFFWTGAALSVKSNQSEGKLQA